MSKAIIFYIRKGIFMKEDLIRIIGELSEKDLRLLYIVALELKKEK